MAKSPVRAGLIGCGDISRAHLGSYKSCGIEVAALCDTNPQRAEAQRAKYELGDVPIYTDHRKMLAEVPMDFITVATPVAFHAPITIDGLRAGKHVACEKPSTLSIAENRQIVEEATKADRKVIFFSSRFRWADATLAKQFIDEGRLGKIYRAHIQMYRRRGRPGVDIIKDATWFIDRKLAGGGIIMDMGQYFMDLLLNLTSWPTIDSVSATSFRGFDHDLPAGTTYDVEEHCTVLARSGADMTYTFDLAWIAHQPDIRVLFILGTKGGIRIDSNGFAFHTKISGIDGHLDTTSTWKDKMKSDEHVYTDFVAAIQGNDPGIGTTPEQALAITELTQMALLSAEHGREYRPGDLSE